MNPFESPQSSDSETKAGTTLVRAALKCYLRLRERDQGTVDYVLLYLPRWLLRASILICCCALFSLFYRGSDPSHVWTAFTFAGGLFLGATLNEWGQCRNAARLGPLTKRVLDWNEVEAAADEYGAR